MTTMYALTWKFSGGSSCGLVRVFTTEPAANALLDVLREHGDPWKTFVVEPVIVDKPMLEQKQ